MTARYRWDALTSWAVKPLTLGAGHLWVLMSPWSDSAQGTFVVAARTRQICKRRGFLDFDGHLIEQQNYWSRLHQAGVKFMFFVRSVWLLHLVNLHVSQRWREICQFCSYRGDFACTIHRHLISFGVKRRSKMRNLACSCPMCEDEQILCRF